MKITDIRLFIMRPPRNRLLAFATLTFDEALVIEDFRVIEQAGRPFVGLPQRRAKDGSYRDIVYPINAELMDAIQRHVVRAYLDETA